MQIRMNVKVQCKDGPEGHSVGHTAAIILDPKTQEVTHVVVKGSGSLLGEYLVPAAAIDKSTQHEMTLNWSLNQLAAAPRFDKVMAVGGDDSAPTGAALFWPYAGVDLLDDTVAPPPAFFQIEETPNGEMAVHVGAHVEAADGRIGTVDEFIIDRKSSAVTHIVLRHGHLWGKREILVPVHDIDHIKDDTVHLKLSKADIEELPDQPKDA